MSTLVNVEVMAESPPQPLVADSYDYERLPPELRDQAMLAQGTVLTKLGGAVERVIDAGNTLRWAKETLPHGEYLPWVQQACGLKPQYASRLIKATEWANVAHVQHLDGLTDTATLFLLSADTTPEEVREWFMERCAAGNPPSRKEVQERKRAGSESGRQRSVIDEALKAFRLSDEARSLAAAARRVTTRQLMDELQVEELPKGKQHITDTATFVKDQEGWIKFSMNQPVDVESTPASEQSELIPVEPLTGEVLAVAIAAERMGYTSPHSLSVLLTPSKVKRSGFPSKNGWVAEPHSAKGKCVLKPILTNV